MRKVRIKKLPFKMQDGGFSNVKANPELYRNSSKGYMDVKKTSVRNTLTSVTDGSENVEAEGGETVVGDFQKDGLNEFYNIEGPRHADGPGVPLKLPESFIFSDTKKMKIKDPNILKLFGKSSGSYTPATLSKQYKLNDFNAKLNDKDSDRLERETSELMISNNNEKLAKLAIVQEVGLKGDKVPSFAFPYLQKKGIDTTQFEESETEAPMARNGGYIPRAQGGTGFIPPKDARAVDKFSEGYNPYTENPNYAYQDTPGYKVPSDQKGNFGPADILRETGKYSTFHRLAKEAGIANDPAAMQAAAKILHETGQMPAVRKNEVLNQQSASTSVPGSTCPPDHVLIDGNCVSIYGGSNTKYQGSQGDGSGMSSSTPTTTKTVTEEDLDEGYPNQPFFTSDVVDLYGAAMSLFDNVDIPPTYMTTPSARTVSPVLEDPTRAIAARQEGAAKQLSGVKVFGRNPSAAASYIQGLASEDIANIISGVNQRNIGTLNQTAGINSQILSKYDNDLRAADRQYDMDQAVYRQQKHNTRAQKRNVFVDRLSKAYSNQADINTINAENPAYYFSTPENGVVFNKGKGPRNSNSQTGAAALPDFTAMTDEQLERYTKEQTAYNAYMTRSREKELLLSGRRNRSIGR